MIRGVNMQVCKKCNTKLGYGSKLCLLLSRSRSIKCKGCGSTYYLAFSSRIISICLLGAPLLLLNYFTKAMDITNRNTIYGGYLVWFVLVILVMPFWAKYNIRE